jgi:ABC-2 type transport system ATP-binding protein
VSKNKTVLFSTHIMQEVQALCDRVIVINKGEIVADDLLSNLLTPKGGSVAVIAEFGSTVETGLLSQLNGIAKVERLSQGIYRIEAEPAVDIRPAIFRFAADQNLSLLGLKQEENSLEAVFRELTSNPS